MVTQATMSECRDSTSASPTLRLPDFLVIGAPKAGTTTLHEHLCRHPDVVLPTERKELNYFGDHHDQGMEWYASHYKHAQDGQKCGEVAPMYGVLSPGIDPAARIAVALPKVKLIYICRHPIDRAWSQYLEQIKTERTLGMNSPYLASFENFIEQKDFWIAAGDYVNIYEHYRKFFPKEAFLLLLTEDLRHDQEGVLRSICRHIGVDPDRLDLERKVQANTAKQYSQWERRKGMTNVLRRIPGVEKVGGLVPKSWRNRAYELLERLAGKRASRFDPTPTAMQRETRQRLIQRFKDSNRRLGELLGRDLSHWDS